MATTTLALVGALALVGPLAAPVSAGDPTHPEDSEPYITFSSVSWLSPTHLGGHMVVDGGVHGSGGDLKRACWEAWASRWNWMLDRNARAEEAGISPPFPDVSGDHIPGVAAADRPSPGFCTGTAAKITEPLYLDSTCEPGTVFAVRVNYVWVTGPDHGRFVESIITLSPMVDELIFNFCLDLFIDEDPASFLNGVPEPGFSRSPAARGLTGLDTWLWYDFAEETSHLIEGRATIDAIDGLPLDLTARAWVDKVVWDMDGDGGWDRTLDIADAWNQAPPHETYVAGGGSDSEHGAAATFRYETKGVYPVTVGVVWRGVYRFSDPALDGLLYPYPPVTRSTTVDYPVVEIISRVLDAR